MYITSSRHLFCNWKLVPLNCLYLFCPFPQSLLWQLPVCFLCLWVPRSRLAGPQSPGANVYMCNYPVPGLLTRGCGSWPHCTPTLPTRFIPVPSLVLEALFLQSLGHSHWQSGLPRGSVVKNLPAMQEPQVWSLGLRDPLEEEMATHSSILAWRIPRTEEPGGLQSTGS